MRRNRRRLTLTAVSFSEYMSAINYFQEHNFVYHSDNNTGNKTWTYNKKIIAKRIVDNGEDDLYFIDKNLLTLIHNNKN